MKGSEDLDELVEIGSEDQTAQEAPKRCIKTRDYIANLEIFSFPSGKINNEFILPSGKNLKR